MRKIFMRIKVSQLPTKFKLKMKLSLAILWGFDGIEIDTIFYSITDQSLA